MRTQHEIKNQTIGLFFSIEFAPLERKRGKISLGEKKKEN